MRASVLTYHSGNIAGNDYGDNNLVALAHDLEQIHALKLDIVPLRRVVDTLLGASSRDLPERVVAITLDDGLDFDFVDLVHPFHGSQISVDTILRRFSRRFGVAVHATSFVIASPDARRQIAKRGMLDEVFALSDEDLVAALVPSRRERRAPKPGKQRGGVSRGGGAGAGAGGGVSGAASGELEGVDARGGFAAGCAVD